MGANPGDVRRQRLLTTAAIIALLAVAVGVFGGMYALARAGTFDALLGRTPTRVVAALTRTPTATSLPPTAATASEAATPSHTLALVATMTPRSTAPVRTLTLASTGTLVAPPSATPEPSPSDSPTPTATADPRVGQFRVEYLGCDPRGSDIGIVKGQIFDAGGKVVAGAEVRVQLDGWNYDQPAISNGDGWYEFYLQKGLKVRIVSLRIEGQEMALAANRDQEFLAQGCCFEYVNLRQY